MQEPIWFSIQHRTKYFIIPEGSNKEMELGNAVKYYKSCQ